MNLGWHGVRYEIAGDHLHKNGNKQVTCTHTSLLHHIVVMAAHSFLVRVKFVIMAALSVHIKCSNFRTGDDGCSTTSAVGCVPVTVNYTIGSDVSQRFCGFDAISQPSSAKLNAHINNRHTHNRMHTKNILVQFNGSNYVAACAYTLSLYGHT